MTNIIKAARNSPQERPPVNNKVKNKKAVTLHRSAYAELECNEMKGRAINGGEELRFDANRMIKARESNSLSLKEIVPDAKWRF